MEVPGLVDLIYDSEEQLQPAPGEIVSGNLPDWLVGSLYRAGPGKFKLSEEYRVAHLFDGLAIAARFQFQDGKVTLIKRFVETDAYKKAIKNKKNIFTEFGSHANPDPDKGFLSRVVSSILPTDITDNCFNNIYSVNGQLFAAGETSLVTRVDPDTLATLEKVDLSKHLGVNVCCSHPITDTDGTTYTMGVSFIPTFKYQLNRIPPASGAENGAQAFGHSKCLLSMSPSWATAYSFYHSFGLTDNYIIFFEQPLVMVLSRVVSMVVKGNSLKDTMEWHPEYKVKVYVVHKETGKLVKMKYITDVGFFQNHVCNAYEENEQIVLDVVTAEDPGILDAFFLDKMEKGVMSGAQGRFTRLVIPVGEDLKKAPEDTNLVTVSNTKATAHRKGDTITLSPDFASETGVEYPTINLRQRGKPYRYAYFTGLFNQEFFRGAVARLDVQTQEWLLWRGEEATFPSEATFVARPGGSGSEEDGVLLVTLLGSGGRADQLVVLDAGNMSPLARVQFNCRIPQMVHGLWMPK